MHLNLPTDIHYIGVDDTDLELFESQYIVPNGIAYNSYLVVDEKIAIMDTADHRKKQAWWENLRQTLGSRTPDYLIVHHLEPDHSGIIGEVMAAYPHLTLVTSAAAQKMLPQFFEHTDFSNRIHIVKEGDTLSLGKHTLQFFGAAMVHWPEVIVSYEQHTRTLFSADAFGKFGVLSHDEDWACEARRYYFNICGKYGAQVQNLLKKLGTLDVATICPLHGPILTENLGYYLHLYDKDYAKAEEANSQRNQHTHLGNVDVNIMRDIAKDLPLSRQRRPQWDVDLLIEMGVQRLTLETDGRESYRIDADGKTIYLPFSFFICAEK